MTAEEIRTLFAGHDQALTTGDATTLAAFYDENSVVESPSFGRLVGRAAIQEVHRRWFAAFRDLKFSPLELLITGDQVVQTMMMEGTDTGGFLGQAPTGKPFRAFLVLLFTVDDLIVHERRVYDVGGLMLQLTADERISAEPARVYAATLEKARVEHEVKMAAVIQRALLPEGHRSGAGFEVAAASVPCRAIGGDFFDYFELPNGVLGFALGDVTGKGPPAGLLAAELQGILATQSYSGRTPAQVLTQVNHVLLRRTVESRFATLVYGTVSPAGRLTYSNGGHNPPLLMGRRENRWLETGGLLVGAFPQAIFEEEELQLDPGDVLVAFSDGVTEALDTQGVEFGEERLLSCVTANRGLSPKALLACVLDTVREFSSGATQSDDLTALVLRYGDA